VLDQLFDAVKPTGVIVNVSIWGKPAQLDMQKLVLKEIDLRGTIAYVRDHAATIKLVQEGKVDLEPFITGRIALDDLIDEGFDTLINRNETAVKIIVHP
jgi:(R,R)-butanediol dehydrogenase/meso-butanediol dehydrogenase/diacetyl reductase